MQANHGGAPRHKADYPRYHDGVKRPQPARPPLRTPAAANGRWHAWGAGRCSGCGYLRGLSHVHFQFLHAREIHQHAAHPHHVGLRQYHPRPTESPLVRRPSSRRCSLNLYGPQALCKRSAKHVDTNSLRGLESAAGDLTPALARGARSRSDSICSVTSATFAAARCASQAWTLGMWRSHGAFGS